MTDVANGGGRPPLTVVLDSDHFGARRDMGIWREQVARHILGIDFQPLGGAEFRVHLAATRVGETLVSRTYMSPIHSFRDLSLRDRGVPCLCLVWPEEGGLNTGQRGQDCDLDVGQGIALASSAYGHIATPRGATYGCAQIPFSVLTRTGLDPETFMMTRFDPRAASFRLLRAYASFSAAQAESASPQAYALMGRHLGELACLALQEAGQKLPPAGPGSDVAARFDLCEAYIMQHFSDAELSLPDVAAASGLSVRTIQLLFEAKGTTYSRFLLDLRLGKALAMLQDPAFAGSRIIDIALKCGFSDVSYFNRRFRNRFGDTPKGVRV